MDAHSAVRWVIMLMGVTLVALPSLSAAGFANPTCGLQNSCAVAWEFKGPLGYDSPGALLAAGAVQAVVQTGTGYVAGSVNGGLWFTKHTDPLAWKSVSTESVNCLSIAALSVAKFDKNIVYSACGGSTSSEMGTSWNVMNTGDYGGLMVSNTGGASGWEMENFPANWYVTGIEAVTETDLLVSARAYFSDNNEGGVWLRHGGKTASWQRVVFDPVYNMAAFMDTMVLAVKAMDTKTALLSMDNGKTWNDWSSGMNWGEGYKPFYPTIAIGEDADSAIVFVGGLTVAADATNTSSSLFYRRIDRSGNATSPWVELKNSPQALDDDAMPKDRMALLTDPRNSSILYVAGNGGAVTWRVDWQNDAWTSLIGNDTSDNSAPHVDCRNYAWDNTSQELLLVSDGGVFARSRPESPGGKWKTLNTGIAEMEFLSAHYDQINNRWAAGAQDNDVQVSIPGMQNSQPAQGIVLGDGTVTAADYQNGRLFGSRQFMGSGDVDQITSNKGGDDHDDDDDFGLSFIQGTGDNEIVVAVPLDKLGFKNSEAFPFFVHPWGVNQVNQANLVFWARGVEGKSSGWYSLNIPANLTKASEFKAPTPLVSSEGDVYMFVAGGKVDGAEDVDLIVAMNGTHLQVRTANSPLQAKKLPTVYSPPVTWTYNSQGVGIVGPVSHGKTVSLAVHPSNAATIAVTGWPSVVNNTGTETIFVSFDTGDTWINVIDNLKEITGTVGMVRPSGLLFVPLKNQKTVLLTGTTRGVYGTLVGSGVPTKWFRVGGCNTFPYVLTAGLSHNPVSDTLVAASMGRGVYFLENASKILERCQ